MIYSAALIQDSETTVVVDITGHGVYSPDKDLYAEAMTRTRPDLYQEVKAVTDAMGIKGMSKLPKFALAAMVADWKTATLEDKQARAERAAQQAKELVDQVAPVVEDSQPVNVYVHRTDGTTDVIWMRAGYPAADFALESFIQTRGKSDRVTTITMDAQVDCITPLRTWVPGPASLEKVARALVTLAVEYNHKGNGPYQRRMSFRLLDALFQDDFQVAARSWHAGQKNQAYEQLERQYRVAHEFMVDEFNRRGISATR